VAIVESNPFIREQSVDAKAAAEFIGCSEKHVLRMARDGNIPAHAIGSGMKRRYWRFLLSQLDEWRRARTNG
jgi:excisionase family DNA binding protein